MFRFTTMPHFVVFMVDINTDEEAGWLTTSQTLQSIG